MVCDLSIAVAGALIGMVIWVGVTVLISEVAVRHIEHN